MNLVDAAVEGADRINTAARNTWDSAASAGILPERPAILREAPTPVQVAAAVTPVLQEAGRQLTAAVDEVRQAAPVQVGLAVFGLDDAKTGGTQGLTGMTPEERAAYTARIREEGRQLNGMVQTMDAVQSTIDKGIKWADKQIEGFDEFITGSRSEAVRAEYMATKERVDSLVGRKDDAGLMAEYKAQLDKRAESLTKRLEVAE
ncbi:MAG: hypothetical protein K2Q01_10570, partial [Rickettsiales bacterium]|nr:hypothetical protein [Rickettsiales bacterium]